MDYYDATNFALKVAHCTATACSAATAKTLDASAGNIGLFTSVAVGTDAFGLISYYDLTNGDLKVVHCALTGCPGYAHNR